MADNPLRRLEALGQSIWLDAFRRAMLTSGELNRRNAADLFRPTYDRTGGQDGFVSLEVSPGVAHDTQATLEEARRTWAALTART